MLWSRRERHELAYGLAFLAPNILGFLAFTIVPLVFSFALAFSNWDLTLHNMFKHEPLKFRGLANFIQVLDEPDFWRFLRNTLFLMLGIPFSIAGSLCAALLLSKDLSGGSRRVHLWLFASAVLMASVIMLTVVGAGGTGMVLLLCGIACGILVGGVSCGPTVYRTLFYVPHFTSGVATFILWKKLYNPYRGPVNSTLAPILDRATKWVVSVPAQQVQEGLWLCMGIMGIVLAWGLYRLREMWKDGELGSGAAAASTLLLLLPGALACRWSPDLDASTLLLVASACAFGWQVWKLRDRSDASNAATALFAAAAVLLPAFVVLRWTDAGRLRGVAWLLPTSVIFACAVVWRVWTVGGERDYACRHSEGVGTGLMFSLVLMVAQLVLLGVGVVCHHLPAMAEASGGLQPPEWLTDYHWAKPAIMIMGFWGAIGSNNMLLYLAGLSNVDQELYEAANVDGASRFQKFWYVTWPQLAPTTFFIVIMSIIAGLQGGFEMARTMTRGGPAGATTTLSYFIYTEGFETGRLGYSSAIAWAMFVLVFSVTLFNWKFGNRYVND